MGKITTDSCILDKLKNEIKMGFLTTPVCEFYPHKMHSKQDSDIIQAETCKLLNKGVTISSERKDGDFVSIFLQGRKEITHTR